MKFSTWLFYDNNNEIKTHIISVSISNHTAGNQQKYEYLNIIIIRWSRRVSKVIYLRPNNNNSFIRYIGSNNVWVAHPNCHLRSATPEKNTNLHDWPRGSCWRRMSLVSGIPRDRAFVTCSVAMIIFCSADIRGRTRGDDFAVMHIIIYTEYIWKLCTCIMPSSNARVVVKSRLIPHVYEHNHLFYKAGILRGLCSTISVLK